jgi:hypothetical protein
VAPIAPGVRSVRMWFMSQQREPETGRARVDGVDAARAVPTAIVVPRRAVEPGQASGNGCITRAGGSHRFARRFIRGQVSPCAGCGAVAPCTSAACLGAEGRHRVGVAGHGVVSAVPSHHACQPLPLLGDGMMPASLELVFDLSQLRPHPLRDRDASQPEPPRPGLPADVREAQKVERLRLTQTLPASPPGGCRPNSISRVFSGCSSSPNFANRSRSSARNRRASSSYSKPATKSSAKRTMITSPCAWRLLHHWAHRSKT